MLKIWFRFVPPFKALYLAFLWLCLINAHNYMQNLVSSCSTDKISSIDEFFNHSVFSGAVVANTDKNLLALLIFLLIKIKI